MAASKSMEDLQLAGTLTEERLAELGRWLFGGEASGRSGIPDDRAATARQLFDRLFLPSPASQVRVSDEKSNAFARLIEHLAQKRSSALKYSLPYPKWEFLNYLTGERRFLLHGSGRALTVLEPNSQTDWNGRRIEAVFATADPIWPIFFATLNWRGVSGSIRNGGFLVEMPTGECKRFYFFSANTSGPIADMFQQGTIHVVGREGFMTNSCPVRFDEWHHSSSVRVLAKLAVGPEDFPFREQVTRHDEDEPVHVTWLRYKPRLGLK